MNFGLASATITFAAAMATSAFAQNSLENCPVTMSQANFESEGGKLVVTEPAKLGQLPSSFRKSCYGHAGLEFVAHTDGSIGQLGVDHNTLGANLGLDDALKCGDILNAYIMMMRYAPIKLKGKPVCVLFNFDWSSDAPDKLTRWDYTYAPTVQRKGVR